MKNIILTGKITAAASFSIGTILLALYLYFDNPFGLEKIGLAFVVIAFIINLILFVILIITAITKPALRIEAIKTCIIMVLNIPIAIGYFFLVIWSIDLGNNF